MPRFVMLACLRAAMLASMITPMLTPRLARAQAAPQSREAVRAAIVALEERIGPANFDCDYRFFAEVEAAEFIFTDSRGVVTTRAEDLAGESTCRKSTGRYAIGDIRISIYDSVAVFNAVATTTTTAADGTPVVRRQRLTDVLVWRDRRWQLVAGHSSRMAT